MLAKACIGLAVEHNFTIDIDNNPYGEYTDVLQYDYTGVTIYHQDHPTKLEATLWAIGLALVKKAETK